MGQATKYQEREALEKIRKIIEGLGGCSYVGMAFDGALELAEENIDNDSACSCQYYIDEMFASQKALRLANENIKKLTEENERLQMKVEGVRKDRDETEKILENEREQAEKGCGMVRVLRDELINLKAKCYDLMTKDAE